MATQEWHAAFAFVRACQRGDLNELRKAFELGMKVDKPIRPGGGDDDKGFLPLHYACDHEAKINIVQAMVDAGANVNAWNEPKDSDSPLRKTPLMLAAYRGSIEVVELLLACGADPNNCNKWKDGREHTALVSACMSGKSKSSEQVVRRLLETGLKANNDCLIWACKNGSPSMLRMVIDAGAEVNAPPTGWGTPLHAAIAEKRADNVEELLRAGADPTVVCPVDHKNYPGQNALDLAKKQFKKVVPMLEGVLRGERPAKPARVLPTAKDVPGIWERVTTGLATRVKSSLRVGAIDTDFVDLKKRTGMTFSEDLQEIYRVHDGQEEGTDGLFPEGLSGLEAEFVFMALAKVAVEWNEQKKLLDGSEFTKKGDPGTGVRPDWWNLSWIPFATDGSGDFLCVDLSPDEGGIVGQVILFQHDGAARNVLADSLAALLAELAVDLEGEKGE